MFYCTIQWFISDYMSFVSSNGDRLWYLMSSFFTANKFQSLMHAAHVTWTHLYHREEKRWMTSLDSLHKCQSASFLTISLDHVTFTFTEDSTDEGLVNILSHSQFLIHQLLQKIFWRLVVVGVELCIRNYPSSCCGALADWILLLNSGCYNCNGAHSIKCIQAISSSHMHYNQGCLPPAGRAPFFLYIL